MSTLFERLAHGPSGMHPGDYEDWRRTFTPMPAEQFAALAAQALQQVSPMEYAHHILRADDGTHPLAILGPTQLSDLSAAFLQALRERGVDEPRIAEATGLESINTHEISSLDLAELALWTRQNYPEALGWAAARFRDQPEVLTALLGTKALLALEAVVGSEPVANPPGRRAAGS